MKPSLMLAMSVGEWLESNNCTVTVLEISDDNYELMYTLRDDVKPQPNIVIDNCTIRVPKGSQQAVVDCLLSFHAISKIVSTLRAE